MGLTNFQINEWGAVEAIGPMLPSVNDLAGRLGNFLAAEVADQVSVWADYAELLMHLMRPMVMVSLGRSDIPVGTTFYMMSREDLATAGENARPANDNEIREEILLIFALMSAESPEHLSADPPPMPATWKQCAAAYVLKRLDSALADNAQLIDAICLAGLVLSNVAGANGPSLSQITSRGGVARWEKDARSSAMDKIWHEWERWQRNEVTYRSDAHFGRQMQLKHPEFVSDRSIAQRAAQWRKDAKSSS